ncbi:MAG: hypothetical protein GEU94_14120 [Micromonosporaceae bacterium]|nr:hypothetical protein [Micromonosporaceae bacterium]
MHSRSSAWPRRRLQVDSRQVHGWCALDALFLPGLIGAATRSPRRVRRQGRRSRSPSPRRGSKSCHPGAVASMLLRVSPDFCDQVHFFVSQEPNAWTLR